MKSGEDYFPGFYDVDNEIVHVIRPACLSVADVLR